MPRKSSRTVSPTTNRSKGSSLTHHLGRDTFNRRGS